MDWIVEAGGEVVSMEFTQPIDFLVTGLVYDPDKKKMNADSIVTYCWIEDCLDAGKILDLDYFHRPINIDPSLKPCTVG